MVLACLIWGFSPIVFKAMTGIPPLEILAHRTLWSLLIFCVVLVFQGQIRALFAVLTRADRLIPILIAGSLILSGWWIFIWSIQSGRATQTALGFYIFPLVAVLLGRVLFGEALARAQWGAVALVAVAVLLLTYGLGKPPWIALVLAANFAIYGAIKKRLDLGPVLSVTAEVLVLVPVALFLLWQANQNGSGHFGGWTRETALLIFAGPLTAVPLILFSYAARRLTLTTMGLTSYTNPTLQFFCAVVLFGELFTGWHVQAFVLIWSALALYSISMWRQEKVRLSARRVAGASGSSST
jgi:chloramphenicol-sensitive protein RarD